ncbi:MAG TPA: hypothetical protein VJY34_12525 [Roseiarcus sp.]|nr:hypothetical protein [Roseiarcus sp.]
MADAIADLVAGATSLGQALDPRTALADLMRIDNFHARAGPAQDH